MGVPHTGGPRSGLLWDLKLRGDVNETHNGGNASKVLFERSAAHGFKWNGGYKQFVQALAHAEEAEMIKRLRKGTTTYAIRLQERNIKRWPDNPFKPAGIKEVALVPDVVTDFGKPSHNFTVPAGLLALPISERVELANELIASVSADMNTFKQRVLEGL